MHNVKYVCSYSGQTVCTNEFINIAELETALQSSPVNHYQQQRIVPALSFSCRGAVIRWLVGARWEGSGGQQTQFPDLQMWRSDASDSNGNTYIRITSTTLTAAEESPNDIYTFTPASLMEFQEGDILGIFQPRMERSILSLYFDVGAGPINHIDTAVNVSGGNDAPSVFNTTAAGIQSDDDLPLIAVEVRKLNSVLWILLVRIELATG